MRRAAVAVCVAAVLVCIATVVFARGRAGHVSVAQAYDAVRPTQSLATSGLPASVPSGRSVKVRGLFGVFAFFAALAGIWGLVGGDDSHAEQADMIRKAGARVVQAPVAEVGGVERDSGGSGTGFSATVTVLLKGQAGHESVPATLVASTHDEPTPGGTLAVMYSPADIELGAVQGDSAELERLMNGNSMSPALAWALGIVWLVTASAAVGVTVLSGRLRAVTNVRQGTRFVRGTCAGSGPWRPGEAARPGRRNEALLVRTGDGQQHLRFRVQGQASAIAEVADSDPVWVCWEAADAVGSETLAAVVIADSGWALHGHVWASDARRLEPDAIDPGRGDGPVDAGRTVKLWSPATSWPLILRGSSMLCVVLALACAAVLVTDLGVRWRWGLGAIGTSALLAALATYAGPATKKVTGTLNRRRSTAVSRVSV